MKSDRNIIERNRKAILKSPRNMKLQTRNYYLLQREEIMRSIIDTPR